MLGGESKKVLRINEMKEWSRCELRYRHNPDTNERRKPIPPRE